MEIFQCRDCMVFFQADGQRSVQICPDCQDDNAKKETRKIKGSNLEQSGGVGEGAIT